jgi:hypothetical protein
MRSPASRNRSRLSSSACCPRSGSRQVFKAPAKCMQGPGNGRVVVQFACDRKRCLRMLKRARCLRVVPGDHQAPSRQRPCLWKRSFGTRLGERHDMPLSFAEMSAQTPEPGEVGREAKSQPGIAAGRQAPCQRSAEIRVVRFDPVQPRSVRSSSRLGSHRPFGWRSPARSVPERHILQPLTRRYAQLWQVCRLVWEARIPHGLEIVL